MAPFDSRWAIWYRKKESEAEPDGFEEKHTDPGRPVQQDVNARRPPSILENIYTLSSIGKQGITARTLEFILFTEDMPMLF